MLAYLGIQNQREFLSRNFIKILLFKVKAKDKLFLSVLSSNKGEGFFNFNINS